MRCSFALPALALVGLASASVNTPSHRCKDTLTATNGCQSYVTIRLGDTCASILAGKPGRMSTSEFLGANPNVNCRDLRAQVGQAVCVALPSKIYPGSRPFRPVGGCTKLRKITSATTTCASVAVAINDAKYTADSFSALNGGLSVNVCASLPVSTWFCSCDGSSLSHTPPPTCKPRACKWGKQPGWQCEHDSSPCSPSGHPVAPCQGGWTNHQGHRCDSQGRPVNYTPGHGWSNHAGQSCDSYGVVRGSSGFGAGLHFGSSHQGFGLNLGLGGHSRHH